VSENVTESDSYDPTVIVPQVGDTTYPAVVPQGMGQLANRANFVIRRLRGQGETESLLESAATASEDTIIVPADSIMGGGNMIKAAFSATANRIKSIKGKAHGSADYSLFVSPVPAVTTGWTVITGTSVRLEQSDTSAVATGTFFVPYTNPGPSTTLVRVRAFVRGTGHLSLPSVMPKVEVFTKSQSTGFFGGGDITEIGSDQSDDSPDTTNYNVFHTIDWEAPANTLVTDLGLLTIRFSGEEATGTEDLELHGFRVFFSPAT
jgi:hypothetical protein